MSKNMFPSKKTITVGQAAKFSDLFAAKLRKSGLPSKPTQYVLENESNEIVNNFIDEITRRVNARIRATESHILERQKFDYLKLVREISGHEIYFLGKENWHIQQVGQRTGNTLDAGQIIVKNYRKKDISQSEKFLERIKAATDNILLDGDDFMALWCEEGHDTLNWLYDVKGIKFLSFWGTILQDCDGSYHVMCLSRHRNYGDSSIFWSSYNWALGSSLDVEKVAYGTLSRN